MRCRRLTMYSYDPKRPQGDLRAANRQDSIDAAVMAGPSISRIKKKKISPPSKCLIALFGPLGNGTCLPTTRRLAPANCESVCDLQKHPYLEQPFALPTALLYSLLASTECLLLSTDKATIFFRRGSPPPRLFCRGVCRWPCVRRRTHIVYSKTSWLDLFHRRYYRAAESHLR